MCDAAPEKMQPCILASPCIALYIYKTMNISRAKKKLENVQKKVGKYAAMPSFALVNAKAASPCVPASDAKMHFL